MKKLLLASLALCASFLHATTVTGTINLDGVPFNGYMSIQLAYPATTGTHLNLNGTAYPTLHQVTNGTFTALTVDGNDILMPRGTYYMVTYFDPYKAPILRAPYFVSGTTFDLGQALPTPITTANVNFLDLLGLRNVSIQNLTVQNSIQFGTGTIVSSTGISNAKTINSIVFAQYFQSASTTCGLQEAYNSLPSYGGWIIAPPGSCTMLTTFTISKPILLSGYGSGSVADNINATTYFAGTELVNGSVSQNSINVALVPGTIDVLGGVEIRDLALIGNKTVVGATTGSGIGLIGGNTDARDLHDVTLQNLFIYGFKGDGITVQDKVTSLNLNDVQSVYNFGTGLQFIQTQSVTGARDIHIESTNLSNNTAANLYAGPTNTQLKNIRISKSTLRGSAGHGIDVDAADINARLNITDTSVSNNGTYDIYLAGGFGHVIERVKSVPTHFSDANITATQNILTSATAGFTAGSVGSTVVIAGAGAAGANLSTTISGFTNSTTVTLTLAATNTVANADLFINPTANGIYLNMPAAATGINQATLKDDEVEGHATCDYYSAAAMTNIIFYPQVRSLGTNGTTGCLNGATLYPVLSPINQIYAGFHVVATSGIFTTCTMVGHSSTDVSCVGTQNWSPAITGSYYALCMPYQAGFAGGADTVGMTRAVIGISAMTGTNFTYWTSSLQGGTTGANEQAYCVAVQ